MSKHSLVDKVAAKTGCSIKEAEASVAATLEGIKELTEVGNLQLRGFGTFRIKIRKARIATNPQNGEPVQVPEKRVLTFKPATSK